VRKEVAHGVVRTSFVAGAPLVFEAGDLGAAWAGRRGGVLPAMSAKDGAKRAEYKLGT
jgi:hypothetical protein